MKRKTRDQLRRELLLGQDRFRRRQIRKSRAAQLRRLAALGRGTYVPANPSRPVIVRAPRVVEISTADNRSKTLRFLQHLRRYAITENRQVQIDFADTERLVACGTLLMAAELHRISRISNCQPAVTCNYPNNEKVEQVLQQIGLLQMFGKQMRVTPTADDVVHWRFIDGSVAEGEKANRLLDDFRDRLPNQLARRLYDGIVEAMTNCVKHAYGDMRNDSLDRRNDGGWWMFAQERHQRLSVVFCDLGIGIPRSLPLKHASDTIRSLLGPLALRKRLRDVDAIEAATRLGATRTRRTNQGLGLADFKQVVDAAPESTLAILSNAGRYLYERTGAEEARDIKTEFPDSILGTLILWSLPLYARTHDHDDTA